MRFTWEKLDRLDEAVAWHRDAENAAVAHVWHLENISELAVELRRLMELSETDAYLVATLWAQVPGDERGDVIDRLQDPRESHPEAAERLAEIVAASGSKDLARDD